MTRTLRIGTRGSQLALVQARWVAGELAARGIATEITIIRTEGDDRPVDTAWGEGAFVGRIVSALLDGTVDLAVHSAKDVPTDEHPRLVIAAYPRRADPSDALVCRVRGTTLATLPRGARVGTDSPRRVAFLRAVRPDLQLHPLHGNVDTRLAKLDRGDSDALVLAVAGLTRLGLEGRIDDILPASLVSSAPGQGSLALQVRCDDDEAIAAVGLLDDPATRTAVHAERALLNATGGGCRSPIGALGTVGDDGRLHVEAAAERTWTPSAGAPLAGSVTPVVRVRGSADPASAADLALRLAARIVVLRRRPRAMTLRPDAQAAPLLAALEAAGVDAVNVPSIEVAPVGADGALDTAIRALGPRDRVAVTSVNGARSVLDAARRTGVDAATVEWAAVGEGTRGVLRDAGIDAVFVPTQPTGAALGAELPIVDGARVLLARGDLADPATAAALRARGADLIEVVAYATTEAPETSRGQFAAALDDGPVDVLVVTSGSTARGVLGLAGAVEGAGPTALRAAPVIAIGEPSARAAREAGFATVLVAPSPEPAALAAYVAASLGVNDDDVEERSPAFLAGSAAAESAADDATSGPGRDSVPAAAGGSR